MNILFLGEIIGSPGRKTIKKLLPTLKNQYKIDLCLANGEHTAHGLGTTRKTVEEIISFGVDYLTSGNHVFKFKEFKKDLNKQNLPIIRPANYPPGVPGKGSAILDLGKKGKVLLINLMGRSFMREIVDCPMRTLDEILKRYERKTFTAIIVDFHAETTSEKQALGWYASGRVSAVVGSHTHIPTADTRILEKKTAYVTDLGMVGSYDSVLGEKRENIINHLKLQTPHRFDLEEKGPKVLNSVLINVDKNGWAKKIERVDQVVVTNN